MKRLTQIDREHSVVLMLLFGLICAQFAFVLFGQTGNAFAAPNCPDGNHIVCENSLPGNPSSEWEINGIGDSSIQGFATDISVNLGETVRFKIDTPASDYRLEIYRMGYYGGDGARRMATVQPTASLPQFQPPCLSDSTGLLDCGNWAESASWTVPADATSGIYFAKAIREDGGNAGLASHIVFVVRDDASTSDLLFQTSDTTWQAYNNYGGNNLYGGNGPGGGLSGGGRAYKVSYNRPFSTRNVDNGQDWVFNAEYPMVRWLEANGYDMTYMTGIDADRRGNLISNHNVFLSVAHDEYWSAGQRTNVEAARDAGVHLAFFSGNEIFWKIRWENSIDGSGTPHRTLVCYKETHEEAKIDPSPNVWTGTWRDPRFSPPADGGRPENELTGVIFGVNGGSPASTDSIRVPEPFGKLRFWRNTSVANLAPGNEAILPFGTLGYEWDEDLENGFRPAGLIRLSSTTLDNAPILVDFGSTFGSATATHSLTLYRDVIGGSLVFGAGTVQWSWGLDSNHDRSGTQISQAMQQATVNLFADMGVQPDTLQSGLVAATQSNDNLTPVSSITAPEDSSTVPLSSTVTITGTASDSGGGLVAGVEVSLDGGSTWSAADGRENWTYDWDTPGAATSVNIRSRATDDSLNSETPDPGITVLVNSGPDTDPPAITVTSPVNGASGVGLNALVAVTFNEAMTSSSINSGTFELRNGATLVPATISYSGNTATLRPNALLTENTTYSVTVQGGTGGVEDLSGNPMAADVTWQFTTGTGGSPNCSDGTNSIWPDAATPAVAADPDTAAVELGVKFISDLDGFICGIRFYKSLTNTGTHIGNLWSVSGQLLASATFVNETTSGWQQVIFANPVAITAGTTYVASYHAPVGQYSITEGFFDGFQVDNPPLQALENSAAGGNGVFVYGPGGFPVNSFQSTNYWVDVVFTANTISDVTPPVVTSFSPADNSTDIDPAINLNAVFNEPLDPATVTAATFELQAPGGAAVTATVSYSGDTATLTPSAPLAFSTLYTAIVRGGANGVSDVAGNPLAADVSWQFTTDAAPDTTAPTVVSFTPLNNSTGIAPTTVVTALFSEALDPATVTAATFELQAPGGAAVTATVSYSGDTATLTPSAPLAFSTLYTAIVRGGANGVSDVAGNPLAADVSWQFTTADAPDTTAPAVTSVSPEADGIEISVATTVSAVFSEPLDPASVNPSSFELQGPGGAVVTASVSLANATATLVPTTPLAANATYTATIRGGAVGIQDLAGNPLASDFTWEFTTETAGSADCSTGTTTIWPATTIPAISAAQDTAAVELGVKFTADVDGLICGLRFYKDVANTGTHTGNLWTLTGQLLASATFTNESPSGWQQVNFATPVAISANTTYVASYHAPVGSYSVDLGYFNGFQQDNPPLHALEDGISGGNGVFLYGTGGFPTNAFASNYWVDVVFAANSAGDTIAPVVTSTNPAADSTGLNPAANINASFSEALDPLSVTTSTFDLEAPGGVSIAASISYSNNTATLTPIAPLALNTTYTATIRGGVSGIRDLAGNVLAADFSWQFTTAAGGSPDCSVGANTIWPATTTPTVVAAADNAAVELGVKFASDVDGFICGIRFYKATSNIGTHVGNLWTIDGQLLATATFANETVSGWQQVNFAIPVAVTANTTYIASYHAPVGQYSVDIGYFTGFQQDNPPLRALEDVASGGNGVFIYGPGGFPTNAFASNYWVDVVFTENAIVDVTAPEITSVSPPDGGTGIDPAGTVSAIFNEAMNSATVTGATFELQSPGGSIVTSTIDYSGNTATLTPAAPLEFNTLYTAIVRGGTNGVTDLAGNPLAGDVSWQFTTAAPADTTAPTVTSVTPPDGSAAVDPSTPVSAVFSEAMDPATVTGITFDLQAQGGGVVGATVTYAGITATLTPSAPLAFTTVYTATLRGGANGLRDLAGNPLAADLSWQFTTAAAPDTTAPTVSSVTPLNGSSGVDPTTTVTAVFSEPLDPATMTGATFDLQAAGGALVAAAVSYTGNTATLIPSAPLAFTTQYTATVRGGPSGVRDLAGNALASDVIWQFTTSNVPDTTAPTIASVSPLDNSTAVDPAIALNAVFSESMDPATVTGANFLLQAPGGSAVAATVGYSGNTATLTPSTPLDFATLYTATVQGGPGGVADLAGNSLAADFVWQFTTSAAPDTTAPVVSSVTPAENSTGISPATQVSAIFNEALDPASVDPTTFALQGPGGAAVPASVSYDANTATLTPSAQLVLNTSYTATLSGGPAGVRDLAGNPLAADFVWQFTIRENDVIVLLDAGFDSDTDGFSYLDDGFRNTNQPAYASGTRLAAGGFSGGGLQVLLGGIDNAQVLDMSGAWQQIFVLDESAEVTVSFRYNLTQTATYEGDELSQVLLTVDGSFQGGGASEFVAQIVGDGNGGTALSTGWQTLQTNIGILPAGQHTIAIGGYNNKKTFNDESSEILIDDVLVTGQPAVIVPDTAPPVVTTVSPADASSGNSPAVEVSASFNEDLDPATVNGTTFELQGPGATLISATVSYDGDTASLVPSAPLSAGASYTATLRGGSGGVADLAGNPMAADFVWQFTIADDISLILQADFDTDTDGFVYIDDAFRNTSQPQYASGSRLATRGFTGGGLQVVVGGVDDAQVLNMSGAWQQNFVLAEPTDVTLSLRYNLIQQPNYEGDELSQVLISLDGTLVTVGASDFIAQIQGNGNGGAEETTGWQLFTSNLGLLPAGQHTISIGGFNNKKTFNDESTEVLIDNVQITGQPAP